MKQALLKKEILVDGLAATSLALNIDTGLQELIFQGRKSKDMSTSTSCFTNKMVS